MENQKEFGFMKEKPKTYTGRFIGALVVTAGLGVAGLVYNQGNPISIRNQNQSKVQDKNQVEFPADYIVPVYEGVDQVGKKAAADLIFGGIMGIKKDEKSKTELPNTKTLDKKVNNQIKPTYKEIDKPEKKITQNIPQNQENAYQTIPTPQNTPQPPQNILPNNYQTKTEASHYTIKVPAKCMPKTEANKTEASKIAEANKELAGLYFGLLRILSMTDIQEGIAKSALDGMLPGSNFRRRDNQQNYQNQQNYPQRKIFRRR